MQTFCAETRESGYLQAFFYPTYGETVLKVDIDGDNDDDGQIDDEDDQVEDALPLIVAPNHDDRDMILRHPGVSLTSGSIKIKKTGTGKVIVKNTSDDSVLLGSASTESVDILPLLGTTDFALKLEGDSVGEAELELVYEYGGVAVCSDRIKIDVVKADVIFRKGSTALVSLIPGNLTHGGVDYGKDRINDIGGTGVQDITEAQFYADASDPSVKTRFRITSSLFMAHRLWAKVYHNLDSGSHVLPSGAKPWNVLSTANDYQTANCDEYIHEQFQRAVTEVRSELLESAHITQFESAYMSGGASKLLAPPDDLIQFTSPHPGASVQVNALAQLGQYQAEKQGADPNVFLIAFEGTFHIFYIGYHDTPIDQVPWTAILLGLDLYEDAHISIVTPNGYLNSSFFETIPFN